MILANVTNGIYIAGVNGPFYVIISLDFSVTFDTLNHLLFLKKKTKTTKKNFFCSFCDIIFSLSTPSLSFMGILFQASFSGYSSNLGVAQASQSLLTPLLFVFYTFFMMISGTPILSIITWITLA